MPSELPSWSTADVRELAAFAGIRLIVVDLDGTLVGPGGSQLNEMAAHLARGSRLGRSVELTVATGRALAGARHLVEGLRIRENLPLILYNGSVVVRAHHYNPLLLRHIPSSALLHVLEICRHHRARVLAYYFSRHGTEWFTAAERVLGWAYGKRAQSELNGLPIEWRRWGVGPPPDMDEPGPVAVLVDGVKGDDRAVKEALRRLPDISLTGSGASYIEIRPRDSNKGSALEFVARHMGLSANETLAIGDNDNDVEMLQRAGIGVAVAGASAAADASSDFRCRHRVEAGVVEILRIVYSARRFEKAGLNSKARGHD